MSGATAEADDDDFAMGGVILFLLIFTLLVDAVGIAFIYKVWNERRWRIEAHEQTIQLTRIADVMEGR